MVGQRACTVVHAVGIQVPAGVAIVAKARVGERPTDLGGRIRVGRASVEWTWEHKYTARAVQLPHPFAVFPQQQVAITIAVQVPTVAGVDVAPGQAVDADVQVLGFVHVDRRCGQRVENGDP